MRRARSGQALIEITLVIGVLLMLVCGVIDFGRAVVARQSLSWLSREAANLAARGTPLARTVDTIFGSSGWLDLRRHGYVVLSRVSRDQNGNATITARQVGGDGVPLASRLGDTVGAAVSLPDRRGGTFPPRGQSIYVAELSVRFRPATPVGAILGAAFPSQLDDVAYF